MRPTTGELQASPRRRAVLECGRPFLCPLVCWSGVTSLTLSWNMGTPLSCVWFWWRILVWFKWVGRCLRKAALFVESDDPNFFSIEPHSSFVAFFVAQNQTGSVKYGEIVQRLCVRRVNDWSRYVWFLPSMVWIRLYSGRLRVSTVCIKYRCWLVDGWSGIWILDLISELLGLWPRLTSVNLTLVFAWLNT